VPELTPLEERLLAGLRQAEPARRKRRWLPVVGAAAAAAALLVLTVVRPMVSNEVQTASPPTSIRYLRWVSPAAGANTERADEVWIDDVHHTVRLKSPDFDQTFTDVPEPIALNRPGMPAEFARMSPDVLVADQRTVVAGLPHTETGLSAAVHAVAKQNGEYEGQVLGDLLSKPGLSPEMRQVAVKVLLLQPGVGLLDPSKTHDLTGRSGALYVLDVGPLSLPLVIDMATNTLLSMNKDTIVNR
jgi:hypothetical protein